MLAGLGIIAITAYMAVVVKIVVKITQPPAEKNTVRLSKKYTQ